MIEVYYYNKLIPEVIKRKEFGDRKELTIFLNKLLDYGNFQIQSIGIIEGGN